MVELNILPPSPFIAKAVTPADRVLMYVPCHPPCMQKANDKKAAGSGRNKSKGGSKGVKSGGVKKGGRPSGGGGKSAGGGKGGGGGKRGGSKGGGGKGKR